MKIDLTTEEKIYKAAKDVFCEKGLQGARMQEISDIAGINKALLHYYYRTKEKLFEAVVRNTMLDFFPSIPKIWLGDFPFEVKLYMFVEKYIDFLLANPHVPAFIINVIKLNPVKLLNIINIKEVIKVGSIREQIDKEIEKGTFREVDPMQLMLNIISMCIFPFAAKSLVLMIFDLDDKKFIEMMDERKKVIPETIITWLKNR